MKKILLYVHVPFCPSKCHFCGWVRDIPVRDLRLADTSAPRMAYITAVQEQIRHAAPRLAAQGYVPELMYWGGGTPSMLSVTEFDAIMRTLREEFDVNGVAEATIESSPDTLTSEKLAAYRSAGFTRLSMGVQSFDDRRLARHGRSHRSEQVGVAVDMARAAGFTEINIDLMCGLPDEALEEVAMSVRAAVQLPVTHVSLYPYAPADGTVMHRQLGRGQIQVDRRERKAAYALGQRLLEAAGFPEYSMSYFGHRPCRADLAYYRLEMDWVGFGVGATSLIAHESMVNRKGLANYVAAPTEVAERGPAGAPATATMLMYQGLASFDGIDAASWEERVGVPLAESITVEPLAQSIRYLEKVAGLVHDERGIRVARDRIASTFIDATLLYAPAVGRSPEPART